MTSVSVSHTDTHKQHEKHSIQKCPPVARSAPAHTSTSALSFRPASDLDLWEHFTRLTSSWLPVRRQASNNLSQGSHLLLVDIVPCKRNLCIHLISLLLLPTGATKYFFYLVSTRFSSILSLCCEQVP